MCTVAKRKALFDDKPVEIAELTYVIKQDLSAINGSISSLQAFVRAQNAPNDRAEGGEHAKNVVMMLQGKLADVSVGFKEVLEVRTKNIQASRARTEKFVSGVKSGTGPALDVPPGAAARSDSPLYFGGNNQMGGGGGSEVLTLEPAGGQMQLAMMEEGNSSQGYISARGEAIEAIEKTITELGGIFGQLAQMVSEQSEMVQRIDAETEDVVMNVEGGQRELMKYWSRVSSNRWLMVKMFGVLMIFFLLWVLVS